MRRNRLVDLTPDTLLDQMVEANLLTAFQAEQLRNGRYQGFRLGNYRILDRIGSGGMGQVFLAEKDNTGMRVAIKVLRQQAYKAPKAFERFAREATISARLAHPNIVRVFDFHAGSQPPYLVMEYVDGISLQAAVAQTGPVAWGEAAHIGQQVALGLQHAHEAGLVHRDIKPANLLVDRHGGVKILDLGIVRVEGGESITLELNFRMKLPMKKGRWGQWQGITTLAQWLPVVAVLVAPQGFVVADGDDGDDHRSAPVLRAGPS